MYVCIISTLAHTKVAFADLNDGLVAYYPFNGNADDESRNGNHGMVNGATLTTDRFGNMNKAYNFDGNDYIDIGSNVRVQSEFSEIAWIKPSTADKNYHGFLGYHPSGGTEFRPPSVWIYQNTKIHAGFGDGTSWNEFITNDIITQESWNHVVVTFDETTFKVYINGKEQYSSIRYSGKKPYASPIKYIGMVDNYFSGIIDEVRIYNRALSESEIQELYNEGGSTTPTPTATPTATLVQTPTPTPTVAATVTPTPTPSETGIVFGYVYDEDENPLRSVTVKIDGDDYSDSGTTDEDGYYEFDKVPGGDYTITYTKTGYVTQTAEATVADGDKIELDTVVLQVAQKGSIYGYVTNIRGDPIESVRLTLNGIGTKVKKTTATDSEGFFEFKDLETGIYRIVAKKRFYKAAQQTIALEEGEDKEIEIEMKKTTKRIKMEGVQD